MGQGYHNTNRGNLTPMRIVLLNGSKVAKPSDLVTIAAAVELQIARHFAPAWGISPIAMSFASSAAHVPPGSNAIALLDDPDEPDALGYHTEENDVYYGRVFIKPVLQSGGVMLYNPHDPNTTSVASVVSHEALEMANNPSVNRWVDGPRIAQGSQYSFEMSDAVESDSYVITVGTQRVSVSNFLFPEWFDPQTKHGARVDYLSRLKNPFTMTPGGYMIVRQAGGRESAVYGDYYPEWRKEMKPKGRFAKITKQSTQTLEAT